MAVYTEVNGVVTLVQEDLTQGVIESIMAKEGELDPCSNKNMEAFKSGKKVVTDNPNLT